MKNLRLLPSTLLFVFILIVSIVIQSCNTNSNTQSKISLHDYIIDDGFDLSIIAAEPLIIAPVTLDFDDKGRIWVVEMIGYMPNLEGIGEEKPNGKISILEDYDKDGVADHAKVFLDKLVLPRALAHAYGGLLYTDGPILWFVEIINDQPGKKIVVDSFYAEGGNIEHNSNGLMLNIDNWIYNANYNFRYQRNKGIWIKEPTTYRGQWGITKDNFGRLYYNNNGTNLKGDLVLPNKVIRNKFFKPVVSENQRLASNRVYPIHATSVNRGYQDGVLDSNGYLIDVTAACGPLLYRGGAFPEAYNLNAFVCVPEANLIKRNVLDFKNVQTKASQSIKAKEFIESTDEGFRPVNLFNGPDGAMYIVDMHRGIIQHKAYISQYLTEQLAIKKLDTLQNAGRILKVVSKTIKLYPVHDLYRATNKELIALLAQPNGWLRDRAQQLLILKGDSTIVKDLLDIVKIENEFSTSIHVLYVLDAFNALTFDILNDIISSSKQPETIAHALGLLERYATDSNLRKMKELCSQLLARNNETIDLYLSMSIVPWLHLSEDTFMPILSIIDIKYPTNKIFKEAIISSLEGREVHYLHSMNPSDSLKNYLKLAISNHQKNEMNSIFVRQKNDVDDRTKGLKLFRVICAACHGADGNGIQDVAPPLKGSEYIDGSIHQLASIILHGMTGPVHVGGRLYQINNDMPGLATNKSISDQDIVDIIKFIQNAFAKVGKGISASEVKKLRDKKPLKGGLYKEEQLQKITFER